MPKHTNVVRFKVKAGQQAEFEEMFKSADKWDGMLMHVLAKTGDQTYVGYGGCGRARKKCRELCRR